MGDSNKDCLSLQFLYSTVPKTLLQNIGEARELFVKKINEEDENPREEWIVLILELVLRLDPKTKDYINKYPQAADHLKKYLGYAILRIEHDKILEEEWKMIDETFKAQCLSAKDLLKSFE